MNDGLEQRILEALREVMDPELGVNVVDLGLIYEVKVEGEEAQVTMTATSPACPMGSYLTEMAKSTVEYRVPELRSVRVDLVWEPPWSPERMAPEVREIFGW